MSSAMLFRVSTESSSPSQKAFGVLLTLASLALFTAPLYFHTLNDGLAMGMALVGAPFTMVAAVIYLFTE